MTNKLNNELPKSAKLFIGLTDNDICERVANKKAKTDPFASKVYSTKYSSKIVYMCLSLSEKGLNANKVVDIVKKKTGVSVKVTAIYYWRHKKRHYK